MMDSPGLRPSTHMANSPQLDVVVEDARPVSEKMLHIHVSAYQSIGVISKLNAADSMYPLNWF